MKNTKTNKQKKNWIKENRCERIFKKRGEKLYSTGKQRKKKTREKMVQRKEKQAGQLVSAMNHQNVGSGRHRKYMNPTTTTNLPCRLLTMSLILGVPFLLLPSENRRCNAAAVLVPVPVPGALHPIYNNSKATFNEKPASFEKSAIEPVPKETKLDPVEKSAARRRPTIENPTTLLVGEPPAIIGKKDGHIGEHLAAPKSLLEQDHKNLPFIENPISEENPMMGHHQNIDNNEQRRIRRQKMQKRSPPSQPSKHYQFQKRAQRPLYSEEIGKNSELDIMIFDKSKKRGGGFFLPFIIFLIIAGILLALALLALAGLMMMRKKEEPEEEPPAEAKPAEVEPPILRTPNTRSLAEEGRLTPSTRPPSMYKAIDGRGNLKETPLGLVYDPSGRGKPADPDQDVGRKVDLNEFPTKPSPKTTARPPVEHTGGKSSIGVETAVGPSTGGDMTYPSRSSLNPPRSKKPKLILFSTPPPLPLRGYKGAGSGGRGGAGDDENQLPPPTVRYVPPKADMSNWKAKGSDMSDFPKLQKQSGPVRGVAEDGTPFQIEVNDAPIRTGGK